MWPAKQKELPTPALNHDRGKRLINSTPQKVPYQVVDKSILKTFEETSAEKNLKDRNRNAERL